MPNIPLRLRLIVGLLFVLVAYTSILWPNNTVYLVLGVFALVALVDRFFQQQPLLEEKKSRRSKKRNDDDDIPDDPTWEQLRAVTSRMAQGPTTQKQPSGPVQYNLWGQAEPLKPEQIVRKTQEPDYPPIDVMHPEWFK